MVSCGNRRNSDGVVEWIPAAMLVQLQIDSSFVRLLRLVRIRVKSIVLPHPIFDFLWFPDLPRASALFVTTDCIAAMS